DSSELLALLDAMPAPVFLTDDDVAVLEANRSGRELVGGGNGTDLHRRGGEVLGCLFARESEHGCGTTEYCPPCVIRNSVRAACEGRPAPRRIVHMMLPGGDEGSIDLWFQVSATPIELQGRKVVVLVLDDVTQIVELRELAPFCTGCGRPREVPGVAVQARIFVRKHPDFLLAQELCADCQRQAPPELGSEEPDPQP
ncbi:MAG TPA: PAS domain-containing protein, partial [Terriglobales bacterium]|nr:PAS domain-containing protein [Terriglobales bacterium]